LVLLKGARSGRIAAALPLFATLCAGRQEIGKSIAVEGEREMRSSARSDLD
jgi:hypothetical protein